jgi:hypothetical protein
MTAIHRRVVALVRRYRSKNQRIDFVSSPDVPKIIEHHLKAEPANCKSRIKSHNCAFNEHVRKAHHQAPVRH